MKLIKKSAEVYLAPGPIATIGADEIAFLKGELAACAKGRLRINTHSDDADRLHEMFIAIRQDSYIRPHRHPDKSESFHVVHGAVDVVVFSADGCIQQVIPLAACDAGKAFYYRMSQPLLHTLIVRSDLLVVHEVTNGPFVKDATVFGSFAPAEDAEQGTIAAWQRQLLDSVERQS